MCSCTVPNLFLLNFVTSLLQERSALCPLTARRSATPPRTSRPAGPPSEAPPSTSPDEEAAVEHYILLICWSFKRIKAPQCIGQLLLVMFFCGILIWSSLEEILDVKVRPIRRHPGSANQEAVCFYQCGCSPVTGRSFGFTKSQSKAHLILSSLFNSRSYNCFFQCIIKSILIFFCGEKKNKNLANNRPPKSSLFNSIAVTTVYCYCNT